MALAVNGKKSLDDIGTDDFEKEARSIGLSPKITASKLKYLTDNFEQVLASSAAELLSDGYINVPQIQKNIIQNSGFAIIK